MNNRGRLIVVNGKNWRWRCGKETVIAYSEDAQRIKEYAWKIKGLDSPDLFDRGKWKRTSDGMVRPSEIEKWILNST